MINLHFHIWFLLKWKHFCLFTSLLHVPLILIDIKPKFDFTLPTTLPLVASCTQQIILHMIKGLTLTFLFTKGKQSRGQKRAKILLQSEVRYKWLFFMHYNQSHAKVSSSIKQNLKMCLSVDMPQYTYYHINIFTFSIDFHHF